MANFSYSIPPADQYLFSVLQKYNVPTGYNSPSEQAYRGVLPMVRSWAGNALVDAQISGSYSKGTAIRGSTDIDIFISLNSSLNLTLKQIYDNLYEHCLNLRYQPKKQNVSIGVKWQGRSVDLVPAKRQHSIFNLDHSLYVSRKKTWQQTNVTKQIEVVSNSGFQNEIKLIKIWRDIHRLDFLSFYIELFVIEVLKNSWYSTLNQRVLLILQKLASDIESKRIEDPANSANILSGDYSWTEKNRIATAAKSSLSKTNWNQIIW